MAKSSLWKLLFLFQALLLRTLSPASHWLVREIKIKCTEKTLQIYYWPNYFSMEKQLVKLSSNCNCHILVVEM